MTVPKEVQASRAADLHIYLEWMTPKLTEDDRLEVLRDSKRLMQLTHSIAVLEEYRGGKGYLVENTEDVKGWIKRMIHRYGIKIPEKYEEP